MQSILKNLDRMDIALGLASGLPAVAILSIAPISGVSGLLGASFGVIFGGMVALTRRQEINRLQSSLLEHDRMVDVRINGVSVGAISDAEHARLSLDVMNDWTTYAAEAGNMAKGLLRGVNTLLATLPVIVFWIVVLLALFDPAALTNILAQVNSATPAALHAAAVAWLTMLMVMTLGAVGIYLMMRGATSFGSATTELIEDAVRRHFGVAATGQVELIPRPYGLAERLDAALK